MEVKRKLKDLILPNMHLRKAIVIIGPRQVGKSTLIRALLDQIASKGDKVLFLDGDDFSIRAQLESSNTENLKRLLTNYSYVFIDEAQRVKNIELTAKIIVDQIPHVQLILTGSSALDFNDEIKEPLTGRKWEYNMYPISIQELEQTQGYLTTHQQLESRIIYGMYPDVLNFPGKEQEVLNNLINSYLYKDILVLTGIKKPDILQKLTQALALQIGNEVSYNELAQLLGVNKETVSSYIDLLEKACLIFRVNPFSRNLRNEIKTNRKIYFYDTGLRNALISNFNPLDIRLDKGALWENFIISERIKKLHYGKQYTNLYFWRTKQQQEIDWIEEKDGQLNAYEFKWQIGRKTIKPPITFMKTYEANFHVIDNSNYFDFIG